MILLKTLLLEKFEQFSKLFLDPTNNDIPFDELLEAFKQEGGRIIGNGRFSMVLFHPKWKYVLKVFVEDVPYLQFMRFVLKNPRPSFPKVIDKPRKILPNFKRGKSRESLYIVPLELLIPISRQEFNDIDFYLDRGGYDYSQAPYGRIWQEFEDRVNELNKKYPSLKQFYQDYKFMQQNAHVEGVEDITQRNIMKRSNGEFVFSDPFWHGETPYAAYDRMMKSEIDDFPEYEPPEPEVMGGKRFKKPKPLKPMKRVPEPADEVPF